VNLTAKFQYQTILDELGYIPALDGAVPFNLDQILYDSIKKAFNENLSVPISNVLFSHMCSVHGLSEQELFTNYDLFENSLHKILKAEGAGIIINAIKRNLLVKAVLNQSTLTEEEILDPKLTVHDVLRDIAALKVSEFIRNIGPQEHVVFFYEDENSKDKALSAFFDSSSSTTAGSTTGNNTRDRRARIANRYTKRGLISIKKSTINKNNLFLDSHVSYDELFSQAERSKINKKLGDWVESVHSLNVAKGKESEEYCNTTRLAGDDATWFFKNGLGHEIISSEKLLGRRIEGDKITWLCMYDVLNMTDVQILKEIMAAHSYVILDSPFAVYKAGGR